MGLDPADRKLLIGALILMLLMVGITSTLAPGVPGEQSPIPSTYSTSPGGAMAAYSLLVRLHYPVVRWEESPASLPAVPHGAVLILAEPIGAPTTYERARLRSFVANGGRLIFCGGSLAGFFPDASLQYRKPSEQPSKWIEVSPEFPSAFTRGAKKIRMSRQVSWKTLSPAQIALYGDSSKPLVVAWQIGEGQLLWLAGAIPFTNAQIDKANNLTLLLNAVAPHADGAAAIYWDEYFHGGRGTLWSYVARTPLKWGLLQCVLLTAALLFAFSRRSGPIARMRPVSRLSPLEFIDTLGGLYQRAGATSVPISVAYQHLRLALARRLRVTATLSDRDLALTAQQRLGWDGPAFRSLLERAGTSEKVQPKEALQLVQTLADYLHKLLTYSTPLEHK